MTVRGPQSPPPDYSSIDRNPFNKQLMAIFRAKLDAELGYSIDTTGYAGIIAVVRALADRHRANPHALRDASQRVLMSLFPSWLPNAFAVMFSKPIPHFAAWINAVVTVLVTQWLMGPSKLADDGTTVEIERCRYLEGKSSISQRLSCFNVVMILIAFYIFRSSCVLFYRIWLCWYLCKFLQDGH